MRGPVPFFFAAFLILAASSTARAWAPQTRAQMAEEAVRLMPASLRMALETHREQLLRGVLAPMIDEDGPDHRAPWGKGRLDASVKREVRELIEALEEARPFADIAARFGRLAHFIEDAGFPPGIGDQEDGSRYRHFSGFCESRRERFPIVFYGHDDDALAGGAFDAFAVRIMKRARENDRGLQRAYAAAGDPPDPAHFGDRSIPFAVGSLAYSNTITEIVRAWLAAWQQAGGDMGRTPYWKPPTTKADQETP